MALAFKRNEDDSLSRGQSSSIREETFTKAVEVLKSNSTPQGIRAAATTYNQIWSRDTFITLLGANLLEDPLLLQAAKNSLITLGKSRSKLGMIPTNYDLDNDRPRFFFAGSTDSSLWYIVGLANLYHTTQDKDLLGKPLEAALDAYKWIRHQDSNNTLLIDSQPCSDWVDNAIQRQGKVLYNNALFLMSTLCINGLCDISGASLDRNYRLDYEKLKTRFNEVFAPSEVAIRSGNWPNVGDHDRDFLTNGPTGKLPFHPHFITFNHVDMHFDTLSNMLCILGGISDKTMANNIMSYIDSNKMSQKYPIKVIDPVYVPGDKYFDYEYTRAKPEYWRNEPECYHNGGIWPFVGGFYVLALAKTGSPAFTSQLENLAKANSLTRESGEHGFNEWLHGIFGKPMGQDGQSWNAGMYIAAHLAGKGKDPFGFLREQS